MSAFEYGKYIPKDKDEKEYLAKYNPDKWKKASNTADIAIFAKEYNDLFLLLVKRGNYPYKGMYCLPGGFININESLDQTAARELEEETGLINIPLTQIHTYGEVGREPRDRCITTLYSAIVNKNEIRAVAGDDADAIDWVKIDNYKSNDLYSTMTLIGKNTYTFTIQHTDKNIIITDTGNIAFDHARLIIDAYEYMILKKIGIR